MQLNLPKIKGEYKLDFPLKDLSFFKVGGNCDVLFIPKDEDDLMFFLKNKPIDLPVTCLGNISNTLILDKGVIGCVVSLLPHLNKIEFFENHATIEAGATLTKFVKKCIENGLSSCENLFCIPGTVGGAIVMNAGIPGFEIADVLVSVNCIDQSGNKMTLHKNDLKMEYRNSNLPKNLIITSAVLKVVKKSKEELELIIKNIMQKRRNSQPIGQATCGSTFKNPEGFKAWQLIKESGCDNLQVGGAVVSDIHCNFLINKGNATAIDFRNLIDLIKESVLKKTGILLEEEIITIGRE